MCEETRSITSLLSLAAYDKPIVSSPSPPPPPLPPPPRFISELGWWDGDRDNDDNDWCVGEIVALYRIWRENKIDQTMRIVNHNSDSDQCKLIGLGRIVILNND